MASDVHMCEDSVNIKQRNHIISSLTKAFACSYSEIYYHSTWSFPRVHDWSYSLVLLFGYQSDYFADIKIPN